MAIANFSKSLAFTLKFEGGKSDDPRDPGGRTNQGVTQRTYDAYCNKYSLGNGDVYLMIPSDRDRIYKDGYWGKVTGDSLPAGVDLAVFDYSVNSGPARAIRAYASVGHGKKPADAIHAVCSSRLSFLHALGTWSVFGSGWARRVAACEVTALKMAGAPLGEAHGKMRGAVTGATQWLLITLSGMGVMIGRGWHGLSWMDIGVIVVGFTALFMWYSHNRLVTTARVDALSDALAQVAAAHKIQADKVAADMAVASASKAAFDKGVADIKASMEKM
jgi:Glycosyl hydrolase 108